MIVVICVLIGFIFLICASIFLGGTPSNQWQDPELDDSYVNVDLIKKKFEYESEDSKKDNRVLEDK